ncbi:uncharacterized protein [Diadema setosum]|uniref:uncharacterized protein n=1 Tax=Diadema setosum TaxID=31175 RepID=UPI003B3B1842
MADKQNNRMGDGQNSNRLEDRTREKDRGGAVIFQNGLESSPMQSKLVDILVSNLDKATTWRELKKHFSMFEPVRANVYHSKAQDGNECTQGSVSFSCIANASCAMESMKGSYLRDRKLRIELKRSSQGGDEVRETLGREERPVNNGIPMANPSPQKKNGGWKKGKGKNAQSKSNLSKDHDGSNAHKSSSDAESIDSIAPELVGSGGSRLKFNVNERNVARSESLESWDAETSGSTRLRDRIAGAETSVPRPCTPQGIPLGRGRGRGLSGVVHHEGVMKKPHRPSLADLASRLEEL